MTQSEMTVWKALKTPQLGVVIYNYHGKGMYQLQLQLGETVQILEESSGWYRGFSLRKKANKGIFPKTYIYVKNDKDESSRYHFVTLGICYKPSVLMTSLLRKSIIFIVRQKVFSRKRPLLKNLLLSSGNGGPCGSYCI